MAVTSDELNRERQERRPASMPEAPPVREGPSDDPRVIRSRIERTRAEMGNTIDEIQHRLSPDYLKRQAKENIREAAAERVEDMTYRAERTARGLRRNAVQTIKDNPIPVALIGIGLGWLLVSESTGEDDYDTYGERRQSYPVYGPTYYTTGEPQRIEEMQRRSRYGEESSYTGRSAEERARAAAATAQQRTDEMTDRARERADEMTDRARQRADEMTDRAREQAMHARESARDVASNVQESASETAAQARARAEQAAYEARMRTREMSRQVKTSFWQTLQENPLALGAAAMALGTIVGMAIPSTRYEDELMGETRDRLLEEARDRAEDTVERAKHVAEEAQRAAVEEAKREADRQNLPVPEGSKSGDTGSQQSGGGTGRTTSGSGTSGTTTSGQTGRTGTGTELSSMPETLPSPETRRSSGSSSGGDRPSQTG